MPLNIINRTPAEVDAWLEFFEYPSLLDMQHGYGLQPTGVMDDETAKAMDAPRCAFRAEMRRGAAGIAKWGKRDLAIRVQEVLPTYSRADYEAIVLMAARSWSEVCDIRFSMVNAGGDIVVSHKRIDGAGRTLAYAFFPNGGQLPLVMDSSERWKFDVDTQAVLAHELGHTLGIDHDPDGGGLMAAFYDPRRKKPLPGYDTRQAQLRYGPPVIAPPVDPPTDPGTPGATRYTINVEGRIDIPGYTLVKNR